MTAQIALDWFYMNSTELNNQYGPWPLWEAITNYTAQRQSRDVTSASQDNSPETYGFATGALLILALTSRSRLQLVSSK